MAISRISAKLPQELCAIICQDPCLQTPDLYSLCLVSRSFHAEAERILYVDVCVKGARHIKSFCNSVARRPYLALRVKKMKLYMPPHSLDLNVDDISRMVQAFRATLNLEDLHILEEDTTNEPVYSTYGWVLEDHSFQLKSFTNTYFDTRTLLQFLLDQPTIETLTMNTEQSTFAHPHPHQIAGLNLPCLHTLAGPAFLVQGLAMSVGPKNIVRMHIDLTDCMEEEELRTLASLTKYRYSVQRLSFERREAVLGLGSPLDSSVIASIIGTQMPEVRYLRIMDYTTEGETTYAPLLMPLLPFAKIETIVIHPPRIEYEKGGKRYKTSSLISLRNSFGRKLTAERIMNTLPTLKRFVLVGKCSYVYIRGLHGGVRQAARPELLDDEEWMRMQ